MSLLGFFYTMNLINLLKKKSFHCKNTNPEAGLKKSQQCGLFDFSFLRTKWTAARFHLKLDNQVKNTLYFQSHWQTDFGFSTILQFLNTVKTII